MVYRMDRRADLVALAGELAGDEETLEILRKMWKVAR